VYILVLIEINITLSYNKKELGLPCSFLGLEPELGPAASRLLLCAFPFVDFMAALTFSFFSAREENGLTALIYCFNRHRDKMEVFIQNSKA
jgi:hypothetical protein